jgi:2-phosphosulfolactate phosphatase
MTVDVFFTSREADETAVEGRVTAVVDVIRATSCMVEALANGARAIFPTDSTEEALKLAFSLGRDDTLLCGERKGLRIEGFDLGNSPLEYGRASVEDKQLVMTTTNGTRAFLAAEGSRRTLAASFLNLTTVGEELAGSEEVVVLCAGRQDRFSLEDALCAGFLVKHIQATGPSVLRLNDAGRVALELAERHEPEVAFLASTSAGRALGTIGFEEDLAICAEVDRHPLLPVMTERRIALRKV